MADADKPAPRLRWKLGLGIMLVAVAAGVGAWIMLAGNRTMQVFAMYPIVSAGVFFTLLWWTFLSGVPWSTRLKGLGGFAAVAGLFLLIFRFDAFEGAMVPIFSSRWVSPWWPAVAWIAGVGVCFIPSLSWRARGLVSACFAAALAAATYAQVDAFALKRAPRIPKTGEGDRSDESKLTGERYEEDSSRGEWSEFRGNGRTGHIDNAAVRQSPTVVRGSPDPARKEAVRGSPDPAPGPTAGLRFDWTHKQPPPSLWRKKFKDTDHAEIDQGIGFGRSSFAVVDGRAYTQEQREEDGHESVVCYDFLTGTPIWKHDDESHFEDIQGGHGPRCTPTVVGRRVYTVGATGVLNCLDLVEKGKQLWERNILEDAGASNLQWGMAGSPLVVGKLVIVTPGGGGDKAVIAYDRFTGKFQWAAGNHTGSYASPVLRRIHNVDQILVVHGEGIASYDPTTGKELWSRDGFANGPKINAALPIVVENKVLLSSSYNLGSILLEVNVDDGRWSVKDVWTKTNDFRLKFNDGVVRRIGDEVYIFGLDETILKCLRLRDGEIMWRRRGQQLGPGGAYGYGQMLLVDDTLLITSEDGRVSFVTADPKRPKYLGGFQGLNRNRGLLDRKGIGWNQPVLVNGKLLMRNEREVACYDLSK